MSEKQDEICFSVSSPGKIILHGEHSVVYGKTALAASINHCTTVTWKMNCSHSQKLKLSLVAVNLEKEYDMNDICSMLASPPPVLKQCELTNFNVETPEVLDLPELLPELSMRIPGAPSLNKEQKNPVLAFFTLLVGMLSSVHVEMKPCSISVTTDLQIGAGLGSSASYSVALAAAFWHFIRICARDRRQGHQKIAREGYKTVAFVGSSSAEFSDKERDLISRWAYQCERIMHGNPSGIDNLICTYGSIIQFKKNVGGQGITWEKLPPVKGLEILLVDTKVSRSTSALVERVAQKKSKFPSVIDTIFQVMDQVSLLAASVYKKMSSADNKTVEQELCILECYVVQGDGSSQECCLQELIDLNQGQLVSLGVSHPRLDRICEIAARHGLHAKLTGAGGGGNAFVLLHPASCDIQQLQQELQADGYDCMRAVIGWEGITVNNLPL